MKDGQIILTIAQKKFADDVFSLKIIAITSALIIILFSKTYFSLYGRGEFFAESFLGITQIISLFLPFVGVAIGFDLVNKELEDKSLNVLLTHPVYRDTFIAGKTVGAMVLLALVVSVAMITVTGTMLFLSGGGVNILMLKRLAIFALITYMYLAVFLSIGTLSSVMIKNTRNSLIHNIAICLVFCVAFGMIIATIASIVSGQKPLDLADNENFLKLNEGLQKLTPSHHYDMAASGKQSLSWLGISHASPGMGGILDTGFTLEQWWSNFWMNIVALFVAPIFFIIVSFIMFLRLDIG